MFDTLTRMGSSAAGAYEIERSLRFNSADSTKLERTPSSTGNQKVWTWSGWVKRTKLGHTDHIFGCDNDADGNNNGIAGLYFENNSDKLHTYFDTSGTAPYGAINDKVYRDTAAWYHIVWQVDAVNSDMKIWVNGVEETVASGNMPPNYSYHMNQASFRMNMGVDGWDNSTYSNLYFAEVHYCDGQEYQASDFGETDSNTGQWIPKEVSGLTYGTNGFYLNFSDNSNTTAATLGKDYSGNGNNWTPNNFSVTAGTGNDSLTDTPTNNYCTWNTLDYVNGGFGTSWGAMSRTANGALEMTASGKNTLWHGTFFKNSGKWYYESTGWNHDQIKGGWGRSATSAGTEFLNANCFTLNQNGQFQSNSPTGTAGGTTYGGSISSSDVIGCAIDLDNNTVAWSKNGQWGDGSGNWDETYDNASKISITAGYWTPTHIHGGSSAGQCFANFGQRPFANDPPSGFKTLCASDISTPTIKKGDAHYNTVLYTGNDSDGHGITGVGFQPDFVWIKDRNDSNKHRLYDSIRGVNSAIHSDDTPAADQYATYGQFESFDSDGFTVGIGTGNSSQRGEATNSAEPHVAWCWKAGSSVTNSDGSITSTVRANASAGFSIVQYDVPSGAGNFTVGHGLNDIPELILAKNIDTDSNWDVYSEGIPNTHRLKLNTLAAKEDQPAWGDTSPTSSVFTSLGGGAWHGAGTTMINYCFTSVAGYSECGTYRGNGDADGVFVFTGFRPAFLLIKCTNGDESWEIYDTKREGYNVDNDVLLPDLTDTEGTQDRVDLLSNGFKARINSGGLNGSSKDYIYYAIADRSFKYSNAR